MTEDITRAAMVGRPPTEGVEVGKVVVGEQALFLVGQQPVDGALAETIAKDPAMAVEAVLNLRDP